MSIQKTKLNFGVIGAGRLGYRHALNIVRNGRANLVAVADPSKEARAHAEQDFDGVQTYEDYRDMLNDKNIQAVVIATSTKYHYEVLMDVINAGKQIFVEKPI